MELAAKTNFKILQSYNMDIGRALRAQPFSTLTIGLEFHTNQLLEPLLQFHPLWNRVKTWWTTRADYLLLPISNDEHQEDLQANLARGKPHQLSFIQIKLK
jgi:hypothetical protein